MLDALARIAGRIAFYLIHGHLWVKYYLIVWCRGQQDEQTPKS